MTFLEKLEHNPQLAASSTELTNIVVAGSPNQEYSPKQNYAVTGLVLAGIGLVCVGAGRFLRLGEVAVGAFLGGMACVFLGLIIALLGFIIRVASRNTSFSGNR